MRYSLWHRDTGDNIGDFETEADAMSAVREEIELNDDADDLLLEVFDARHKAYIAGQELVQRAFGGVNAPQLA